MNLLCAVAARLAERAAVDALERELIAEAPELPDWGAEVRALTHAMVERRRRYRRNDARERLRRAGSQDEAARVVQELQDIAEER